MIVKMHALVRRTSSLYHGVTIGFDKMAMVGKMQIVQNN
jgi:hypothetical protein